jgi:hypothetical protein
MSLQSGPRDQFIQSQRELIRENENRLRRDLPADQRFFVDWGGWFNFYFYLYDDGIISNRTLRQYAMRNWAAFSADQGIHEGYVRMQTTFNDWNAGDEYGADQNDLDGPTLERGWYQFDIAKALRVHTSYDAPFELKVKLGRDLVNAGTGYAISIPLDHVQVQAQAMDFETTFIVGKVPSSLENIDRSRPVADHSRRNFWIIQEKYKGWANHEPFAYVAWQIDATPEDPQDWLQNYTYDSTYIGWGSTGELIPNLKYGSEWVIERGTSYGDHRFKYTNDIKAWAFDHRLDYFFRHKTKPTISVEYMFASGEPSRLGSPTDAEGGVSKGFVDRSFIGFGFRDTGLSYAPRLSNIHIWRVGGSFRPLPDLDITKDLELGSDFYLYYKNRAVAAVSDTTADEPSGYLGWEMDHYANYRIFSDLSYTVRLGTFFPGSAYSDQGGRPFLLTGLTWSF